MNSFKETSLQIFNSTDFHSIKDHPNILIAASFFEEDRYCAAKVFYKFMRALDDMIDNHKAEYSQIAASERKDFLAGVDSWIGRLNVTEDCGDRQEELIATIEKFRIPLWPLETFARSMVYDINNDGFPTFESFLDYAQGASVSPASVFVHLAGLRKEDGNYSEPLFNVREAATQCAIFSYLVHIVRDFRKDQLNNLNYFPDDLLKKYGLTRKDLYDIARGAAISDGFRSLIGEYHRIAGIYSNNTREVIRNIKPFMRERYQLSLEIIYDLYLMVYEKIDPLRGSFSTEELNPGPDETKQRVYDVIMNFTPVAVTRNLKTP